ncbi:MAG TPA: DUF5947 family protein [Mycobacteriales bacterium]
MAALRRFREPREPVRAGEVCEMCGEPLEDEHRHVVNVEQRALMCTCRACSLLFTNPTAAQGRYRSVPDRHLYDAAFAITDAQWDLLQIPVSMAFFFVNSIAGQTNAFYPSPAGATESLLSLETWADVTSANRLAALLEPDVEALLVRKRDGRYECYLVPIDACYELVGLVRMNWKGFAGGAEAWQTIDDFFDRLQARSRPYTADR